MNQYNPHIHHRRSIRLKGYDYAGAGLYFITICVQHRACLFGNIVGASLVDAQISHAQMILNDAGKMVESEWLKLPERFKNIELHEYVVMPNHFHAILEIMRTTAATPRVAQNETRVMDSGRPQGHAPKDTAKNKTVGDMMDAFKSITTVEYILGVKTLEWTPFNRKLWQRNYWEHIIRDEQSYHRISNYIINNPEKWADDKFYSP